MAATGGAYGPARTPKAEGWLLLALKVMGQALIAALRAGLGQENTAGAS